MNRVVVLLVFLTAAAVAHAQAIVTPAYHSLGTCATAITISAVYGNLQNMTLTNADACVPTFTQPYIGSIHIKIKVIGSAAGTGTIGTSTALWNSGSGFTTTPPKMTTIANAITFWDCFLDGSATYCEESQ